MFSMNKPVYTQSADEAGGGTLYVGGLDESVVDTHLFETFSAVGPVSSVRVCRDRSTHKSLGYAYVNFQTVADAQRVLDTMNFTLIKGKPCRLMWKQKDASVREKGLGNIYVRNLDESIDNRTLFDTFSMFGDIHSCKVATDKNGASLGYGFIHYVSEESAQTAIEKINGMMINEKKVEVKSYIPQKIRTDQMRQNFTNIYIKNFAPTETEQTMKAVCEEYGEIDSIMVPKDQDGVTTKGYLFCNYKSHESAKNCVQGLNGLNLNGHVLDVDKYKSKSERTNDYGNGVGGGTLNVNLFVKNLDSTVDDDKLKELFSSFGTIKSHKVMRHRTTHESRGFGFVCFGTEADASKAMAEMNGKNILGKDIYVGLAQKKKDRAALLAKEREKMNGGPMAPMPVPMGRGPFGPPMPYGNPDFIKRPPPPGMMPMMHYGAPRPMPPMAPAGRPAPGFYGRRPPQPPSRPSVEHQQAKQEMGEKLYPLVQTIEPQMAGKITGMLLEMEMSELRHLLDAGGDLLLNKINEASQILKMHSQM